MDKQNKLIWSQYSLVFNKIKKITIGDLTVFIHLLTAEIKVAYTYSANNNSRITKFKLENLDWKRWPITNKNSKIQIDPVMPDRPILVKPESSLNLLSFSETKIYIRFPISIKLSIVTTNKTASLIEIPTLNLSNTWFGTFKEGELCYSITSGIRTEIEPDKKRPFMTICPLRLKNKTKESFLIDKICLRSDYITLFLHNHQIWTDEIAITYDGKNEISQVNFSGKEPTHLKGAIIINKPLKAIKKSLYASSFTTIKDLHGAGRFAGK